MLGENPLLKEVVSHWTSSHSGCECPISGGVRGQIGLGPGQPDLVLNLVVGNPAHSRRLELHAL